MKYFLTEENEKVSIFETTKETHRTLEEQGIKVVGLFGRVDYANIWCDFYNGKIDRKQLRLKLKI
jgi:hypothetical protein